jgi:DeoR/GlpR family transcriptional regulator of sugar metabolism
MRFGSLEDVDTLITDTGLDSESAREVESTGVRVTRA